MYWRQSFFRIVGVDIFLGGIFAFYYFGKDLVPLFEQVLKQSFDSFQLFIVLTSFFLGALSLTWVGIRVMALRSFSHVWLYGALLPATAWLQEYYNLGLLFSMDRILSLSITYLAIYGYLAGVMMFVQRHWYTPVSHESARYVGIEHQGKSAPRILPRVLLVAILIGLLILHPADISTTLRMLFSPFVYVYQLIVM